MTLDRRNSVFGNSVVMLGRAAVDAAMRDFDVADASPSEAKLGTAGSLPDAGLG